MVQVLRLHRLKKMLPYISLFKYQRYHSKIQLVCGEANIGWKWNKFTSSDIVNLFYLGCIGEKGDLISEEYRKLTKLLCLYTL